LSIFNYSLVEDKLHTMKFSHLADCHLGSWRQPELRQLNLESFKKAIDISIREKVDFVLIAGDLFDSAYPPIEILEETFFQLKQLKDAKIECYIIAGSHDYSSSGKTFLSVLEKAGFCINLFKPELKQEKIFLNPVIHKNIEMSNCRTLRFSRFLLCIHA